MPHRFKLFRRAAHALSELRKGVDSSGIRQIFEGAVAASNSGYGRSAEKKCSPRAFLSLTQLGHRI
jgi:hypothetical protein